MKKNTLRPSIVAVALACAMACTAVVFVSCAGFYNDTGVALAEQGRANEALAYYDKAVEPDPACQGPGATRASCWTAWGARRRR